MVADHILIVAGVTSVYHPPPFFPNFIVSSVCNTVLYDIDDIYIYLYRHLPGMFTGIPILPLDGMH